MIVITPDIKTKYPRAFRAARKDRFTIKWLETLTILACNHCHDRIEYLQPEEMLKIVRDVIAQRSTH